MVEKRKELGAEREEEKLVADMWRHINTTLNHSWAFER